MKLAFQGPGIFTTIRKSGVEPKKVYAQIQIHMNFTAGQLQVRLGTPQTIAGFGVTTRITPVLLNQTVGTFNPGYTLGNVQSRKRGGSQVSEKITVSSRAAVLGQKFEWLAREFLEHECGGEQARLDRIQPHAIFVVRNTFGFMSHEHGIYEPGDRLLITKATSLDVHTDVFHLGRKQASVEWSRKAFDSLVKAFTIEIVN